MKKKFDAIEFQRKRREELSKKYNSAREAFLRGVRKKYGGPQRKKTGRSV